MFAFPPAIRKVIYITNAQESLHRLLRKIIITRCNPTSLCDLSTLRSQSACHGGCCGSSPALVRTAGLEPAFPFEKQIFVPLRLSPPPRWRSWSGLSLRHSLSTPGAARLVSTPSPGEGLGSGLA